MSNTPLRPGRILSDLTKPASPTIEDLMKLIQAQQAQIETLKAQPATRRAIGFKVSEKGCVTMTGTGQFGTTLYASQWAAILDNAPALAAFINSNLPKLAVKPGQSEAILASVKTYLD